VCTLLRAHASQTSTKGAGDSAQAQRKGAQRPASVHLCARALLQRFLVEHPEQAGATWRQVPPHTNNQTTCLSTAQGCVATDTHCVSLNSAALQGTPSSQPTPVTATNNPKHAQQQDLSTSIASTTASTSPAIIDDALATSPQDLLKDATEKTTNKRPPSLTRFPRTIASTGFLPAASEPISLSRGAPAPATLSNSTPSGESAQASTS
jgi:hypothetical protein